MIVLPALQTKRQKEARLAQLRLEMERTKKEMDEIASDMDREKKRNHIKKLLDAGRIVEEAGLLNDYNANDLYLLLVMNRDYLVKNKQSPTGKFELMRGLMDI